MSKKTLVPALIVLAIVLVIPSILLLRAGEKIGVIGTTTTKSENMPKFIRLEISSEGVLTKAPNDTSFKVGKEGDEIVLGSIIKTDGTGRAEVIFPNGTSTRIDKSSEITLKEYTEAPFNVGIKVGAGRIWSRVAKLLGSESYETESATLTASVRGTSYGHEVSTSGQDLMIITKGTIKSDCVNGNQSSLIEHDQWGAFNCKKEAPKMGAINDSVKDDWFNHNEDEDKKVEEIFGKETFSDMFTGNVAKDEILPKLQFEPIKKFYYFSPEVKPLKDFPKFISDPTPTPKPNSILDINKLDNVRGLNVLATPTPTPTPKSGINTNSILRDPGLNLNILATPTPSSAPVINKVIDPGKLDLYIATPTPTSAPVIKIDPKQLKNIGL